MDTGTPITMGDASTRIASTLTQLRAQEITVAQAAVALRDVLNEIAQREAVAGDGCGDDETYKWRNWRADGLLQFSGVLDIVANA